MRSDRSARTLVVLFLTVAFAAVNVAFLLTHGIGTAMPDAGFYLEGASQIAAGKWPDVRPGGWLIYPAIIALCQRLGIGLAGVVAVQLVAAAAAAVVLHRLTARLSTDFAGAIAAALLILNPAIAGKHGEILTDSLYTSFVVFAAFAVVDARERRPRTWSHYALATAIVLVAAFLRPNGWSLIPVAAGYWVLPTLESRRHVAAAVGAIALAFALAVLTLPGVRRGIEFEDPSRALRSGVIIADGGRWTIAMPRDSILPPVESDDETRGASAVVGYIGRHPWPALELMLRRLAAETLLVRPHYSLRHNVTIGIVVGLLYATAGVGFFRMRAKRPARLLVTIVVAQLLPVALAGSNWDGRYLLFALPLILVFSSATIDGWIHPQG